MASEAAPTQANKSKEPSRSQFMRELRKFRTIVILTMLASLGVFFAVALFGGISQVIGIILSSNLYLYSLAFLFVLLSYLVRFGKWNYYLSKFKIKIPKHKSLAIYLSLYSMSITPGQVGRIIGGYTLNKVTKKGFMKIAPIITMDVFSDFLGFSIIAIVTAFFFHKYLLYVLVFVGLLSISFAFLLHPRLYKVLGRIKILNKWMERFKPQINMYYSAQNEINTPMLYLTSFIFTMPADIMNSLGLYFSLLAIGIKAKVSQSLFIFAVSQIFGMVSTLPGSIGVADATIVGLVSSTFKVSASLSSAATIMARIATLWFGVIIGAIFLFYTMRFWNDGKKESEKKKNQRKPV